MKQKTATRIRNTRENFAIILLCAGVMVGGGLAARAVKPPEPVDTASAQENPAAIEPAAGE